MDLAKAMETRRSVREYINKPVEEEKLIAMIIAKTDPITEATPFTAQAKGILSPFPC